MKIGQKYSSLKIGSLSLCRDPITPNSVKNKDNF